MLNTVGHSALSTEAFLSRLSAHGIRQLADVRRFPGSRRHPHFSQRPLATALEDAGIAYRHFEDLGGHRSGSPGSPHHGWPQAGFRHYADHMESSAFAAALARLEAWARGAPTAVMCAEARPEACHRRLLSDALVRDGFTVVHILDGSTRREHTLPSFARLDGGRIVYDGGALPIDFGPDPGDRS